MAGVGELLAELVALSDRFQGRGDYSDAMLCRRAVAEIERLRLAAARDAAAEKGTERAKDSCQFMGR